MTLPHPVAGGMVQFVACTSFGAPTENAPVATPNACKLLELQVSQPKYGTWLVGDLVFGGDGTTGSNGGGGLYLTTPMDPLYLVLPHLRSSGAAQQGLYVTLADVLDSSCAASCGTRECPDWDVLRLCDLQLDRVCDTRGSVSVESHSLCNVAVES